ncbi:transposase [Cereibacter sediminicola]|uniref:transposase n=1 Tax=Cereibacter sediminicola TaxID=2584941 RepID=UPI00119D9D63
MATPGISTGTVAELLLALGDNLDRIRPEAAFAKQCGVCPIPASSGKITRHRLNRGGHRLAGNAANATGNGSSVAEGPPSGPPSLSLHCTRHVIRRRSEHSERSCRMQENR